MPRAPRPLLPGRILRFSAKIGGAYNPGYGMPADIAKLTEEAEIAQASYEALPECLRTEQRSGKEPDWFRRLTSALMRRDETLFAAGRCATSATEIVVPGNLEQSSGQPS